MGQPGQDQGAERPDHHADQTPDEAQHQGLHEELKQDVEARGAERLAHAGIAAVSLLVGGIGMMFMMPMPPTRRLTAAMPASRYLNVSVVCCKVARMSVWLRIGKSLFWPGRIW